MPAASKVRAPRTWRPRWLIGCGGSRPSARSPSNCWSARSSDATCHERGDPEPIAEVRRPQWTATLYDLLTAYAKQRQQTALAHVRFAKRKVWSLAEARVALERLIGQAQDWSRLDEYLISYLVEPAMRSTVVASSFASALELVREGVAEIHQHEAFAPIYMRKRMAASEIAGDPVGRAGPRAIEG